MIEKEVISGRQLILLVFTFISATATLYIPSIVVQRAGHDGWLSIILGGLTGVVAAIVVATLGQRYPGKSLIEYSGNIIGKLPGKLLGIVYIIFGIHITSIIVREIMTTIRGTLLQYSRPELITFIIFLACAYSVKMGLETITRANILILIMTYAAIFSVFFLLIKDLNPELLTPILSNGIFPVLKDSVTPAGWFCEVFSIAFILPFVNKPGEARFSAIIGVIWSAVTLAIIVTLVIMVFGAQLTAVLTFPTLELVRYINVEQYIQRVEIFFLIPWIISNYIKICFFYYITVLIITKWFNIEKTKTMVIPVGLLIFSLSISLFKNRTDLTLFLTKAWGFYSLPIELGIPILLLIIELIRGKGRQKSGKNT